MTKHISNVVLFAAICIIAWLIGLGIMTKVSKIKKIKSTSGQVIQQWEMQSGGESYDLRNIPYGILQGGVKPELVVNTMDGKMVKVTVPDWVWDTYVNNGGDTIGYWNSPRGKDELQYMGQ